MGKNNDEHVDTSLLNEDFSALGVTFEEMDQRVNVSPKDEASDRGGVAKGPNFAAPDETQPNPAEEQKPLATDDIVSLSDEERQELIEGGIRTVKKKRGAIARGAARAARLAYKAKKGLKKREGKAYRKSSKGKKATRKRKMRVKRMGKARMAKLHAQGKRIMGASLETDLETRLRANLSESKETQQVSFDDIDLLERGALIAWMVSDRFNDGGLGEDAVTARKTASNIESLVERYEKENKFSIADEDMIPAIKAIGTVIDHFEKLEGSGELPLDR